MSSERAYLDLLSELPAIRRRFLKWPNVRNIGLGAKQKSGEILHEWAYRFYVERKLPLNEIHIEKRIPAYINGVRTDVISFIASESLVSVASVPAVDENEYRDQGVRGGISIRNEHFENDQPSGYGTLGILARRTTDNALVGLTCSHIANAASNTPTTLETRIGQPKYWISCCCCPRGWIGNVKKATLNNDLDCALIEIDEDIEEQVTNNNTENKVQGINGNIEGAALPLLHDTVRKYGRTTGLTNGRVVDIAYGPDQILIELIGGNSGDAFAHHGDSGAVIVNEDNQVIGLLVAAAQETDPVTGTKLPLTRAIATLIKPIMEELDIKIAGVEAADVTIPVRAKPWPGGQNDTNLNPVEVFASANFGFAGNVNWDVSGGASGAVIIATGTQTASNLSSISVRYDIASVTNNKTDAVSIKATSGTEESEKFRTVFRIVPTLNTAAVLAVENTKRFNANGGADNQAGVAVPGTDGANWFMAKAEIIYEIQPQGIQWDASTHTNFIVGDGSTGAKGDILARRQSKFTKGELGANDPTPTRTTEANWISAGDSSADDFKAPNSETPNTIFRLANEGFDPSTLLQAYLRADYRDYLELHNGTDWVRITPYVEWFANLTADFNGPQATATAPPNVGAVNTIGAGSTAEPIPAVIYCGFVGNGSVITKTALVNKIVEIALEEHDNWRNLANGSRLEENSPLKFADLVIYCLAVQLRPNSITPDLIEQIQNEVRSFAGLTLNSNFITVSNTISTNLGGNNNDVTAIRIRNALTNARHVNIPPVGNDPFAWSAVFITHVIRQAALDLEIEYEDDLGGIQGRAKILEFGNSHSQYARPALERANNNTLGCYHAIEPDQPIEIGDIIIQDRRNPLNINDVRDLQNLAQQPPSTHGDVVVRFDIANNSVITIGGNTGDSVRRRRYPIDNLRVLQIDDANRRTWTQEPDNGNDPPATAINNNNPLIATSTSRIFAVLRLVEECQELP